MDADGERREGWARRRDVGTGAGDAEVAEVSGDVHAAALRAYRTTAGLLQMPATRHPFTHLNKARRVRASSRRGASPRYGGAASRPLPHLVPAIASRRRIPPRSSYYFRSGPCHSIAVP